MQTFLFMPGASATSFKFGTLVAISFMANNAPGVYTDEHKTSRKELNGTHAFLHTSHRVSSEPSISYYILAHVESCAE
jgi:hypothetical protein